jgi:hypothetical protein
LFFLDNQCRIFPIWYIKFLIDFFNCGCVYIDKQTCELRFGSIGLSANQVRFGWYATEKFMELSDYAESGTWELVDAPAEIRIIHSPIPPYESRTEIVFFMSKLAFLIFLFNFFY